MSNLDHERKIVVAWECANPRCKRANTLGIDTSEFPAFVPNEVLVDCPFCGQLQSINLCNVRSEVTMILS